MKKQQPIQVIATQFKTDKGDFTLYHLVEDAWIRKVLGFVNVKKVAGRATVTDTKRAFIKAINLKAGSRIVFISKAALLKDMDKRVHDNIESKLPLGKKILNK